LASFFCCFGRVDDVGAGSRCANHHDHSSCIYSVFGANGIDILSGIRHNDLVNTLVC